MSLAQLTDCGCYYEQRGRGEPLLLVPGLGCTCRTWDPVVSTLADRFSTIVVDPRGVGRSVAHRPPRRLRDYAADFVELLDHLQVERANVCGISLGGIVAQRFAVDHPDRVNRLALVSCAHRFGPYLREMAMLVGHTLRRFPKELFERTMDILGSSPRYLDANAATLGLPMQNEPEQPRDVLVQQLRCLLASELTDEEYLIPSPTLVVAGEYDVLIPNCYQREMSDAIPDSRFVLLHGVGHNPVQECPERLSRIVTTFLTEEKL